MSEFRPSFLSDSDEGLHPVGDDTLWSENYLSHAYFPAAKVGLWLHHCRLAVDTDVLEEFTTIWLPNDRFLVVKATGLHRGDTGPWAAALKYDCVEPFERWHKSFRGTARLVNGDQLRAGPVTDGEHVFVDLDTEWAAMSPAFDWDVTDTTWADEHSHYEQHCVVTGTLRYGDAEPIKLDGTGLRDHSWGARDVRGIETHIWAHGRFPDGRTFMLFDHAGARAYTSVVIDVGNGLQAGELLDPAPLARDAAAADEGYTLRFGLDGTTHEIRAEILQTAPLGLTGVSELCHGTLAPGAGSSHLFESQTRFTWDGVEGHGLTERSFQIPRTEDQHA